MESTNKTCLAVITARGGSKGIPDKNVRPLNGQPVITYAIAVALGCPYITKTVVTTDSPEIQVVGLKAGAEVPFLRPAALATDTARQEDAILHAMNWYDAQGERFDTVCLVEPTAPLRQVATLNQGFELLYSRPDADAVFSVMECDIAPIYCNTLRDDGFMRDWVDEKYKFLNRQELPMFYQLSVAVTISRWNAFSNLQTFLHDKTLALLVDPVEGKDMDGPLDFFLMEQLLRYGLLHSSDLTRYVGQRK